jgi:hypothetical protein
MGDRIARVESGATTTSVPSTNATASRRLELTSKKSRTLFILLALGITTLMTSSRVLSLQSQQQQPDKDDAPLRDISIVLMGDSITRYQYLSLVYFLRWGAWFDPRKMHPHLVKERSFETPLHPEQWMEFYLQSNRMVAPYESCDCFRPVGNIMRQLDRVCENRYFYDRERNNSVVYIQAFGHASTQHGRLNASTALLTADHGTLTFNLTPYIWNYNTWHDTVRFHIAELKPKPQFVVMNAGAWQNHFLAHNESRAELADALQSTGMKGIWKTTTSQQRGGQAGDSIVADSLMCEQLGACLNLSWTSQLSKDMWWDNLHFYEPTYRQMNEQMLGMMYPR